MSDPGSLQRRISSGAGSIDPSSTSDAPAQPMLATLGLLDGTVIARLSCHVGMGKAVVGRSIEADIMIEDPFVHRVHAEISWDSTVHGHVIRHAGGSNGTFVNLQRIGEPTRLGDGARIRVGKTELVYRRVYYPER